MEIRLAAPLQSDSIVDGDGIRTVIWTQGCSHHCKGCQNPSTHPFNQGMVVDIEQIKRQLFTLSNQDGITFSGGDPMFQAEACFEIAKCVKSLGLNIWCYTGFTFEELMKMPNCYPFLSMIDVLVDGKFEIEKKSLDLLYKGSSNQRIIDVSASILEKKVILDKRYQKQENHAPFHYQKKGIFI